MRYIELDTPALLIDRERLTKNLKDMQSYADAHGVALRPHTKTHKCPEIAKMQLAAGACGIAVAKVGEAEAMAEAGLDNLFIANEIVGEAKLRRIAALAKRGVKLAFGVDTPCQVTAAESVFAQEGVSVPVLVEIEVGENRSGVIEEADFLALLDSIRACPHGGHGMAGIYAVPHQQNFALSSFVSGYILQIARVSFRAHLENWHKISKGLFIIISSVSTKKKLNLRKTQKIVKNPENKG